ncbi:MAG: hypothetical protein ACHQ1D_01515 [Nitrososphaerales archaeon]
MDKFAKYKVSPKGNEWNGYDYYEINGNRYAVSVHNGWVKSPQGSYSRLFPPNQSQGTWDRVIKKFNEILGCKKTYKRFMPV